ncbi:MYXO-CTERM sorting domain-containing protein [Sandaracinus amylolyticus]|uniref:MYXO-CTERM sorting domain-containing protein n=1 Tax=Sandaracinus amylolyticus TaxID=927083 RepID=UPI0012EE8D13|nr:MYXO-CTERM sorting domain-containing protein [Sandaracinus amylolyticus]
MSWAGVPSPFADGPDGVVVLSGDGQRLARHVYRGISSGVVVFRREAGTWVYEDVIYPADTDASVNSSFGEVMHFSHDGSVLFVMAPDPYRRVGATEPTYAAIFRRAGRDWVFESTLTALVMPTPSLARLTGGFSADGRRAVVHMGSIVTFDYVGGAWTIAVERSDDGGFPLALSGDGNRLFLGTRMGVRAYTWSGAGWRFDATFAVPASPSFPIALVADRAGSRVAVTSGESPAPTRIHEQAGGAWIVIADRASPLPFRGMDLSDDGSTLAYGGRYGGTGGVPISNSAPVYVHETPSGWSDVGTFTYDDGPSRLTPVTGVVSVSVSADGVVFAMIGGATRVYRDERALGALCNRAPECASGHCAPNPNGYAYCCDVSCEGECADCRSGHCAPHAFPDVCRASRGPCDAVETCAGSLACPPDAVAPAGTTCRAAAGECDLAELCDGSTIDCPEDAVARSGTECRAASGVCDAAEQCSGIAPECPADAARADGTSCSDPGRCDGESRCAAGACIPGAPVECDDGDACTADVCAASGACESAPIAGCCNTDEECDDGDACTRDTCGAHRCDHRDICLDAGAARADGGSLPDASVRVDGGRPRDGGHPRDGGASGAADATIDADAHAAPRTGGSCACRAGIASPPSALTLFVVVALGAFAARRRRVARGLDS